MRGRERGVDPEKPGGSLVLHQVTEIEITVFQLTCFAWPYYPEFWTDYNISFEKLSHD